MVEPLISANRARVLLAALKGRKKIDPETLVTLVKKKGLPMHPDPFGSGRWCFLESEINAWAQAALNNTRRPLPHANESGNGAPSRR